MNQCVSQGVFDRRVKLIEEKLKHIDGGVDKALLDKLEKENQYYVDQIVDNINSGIISFDSINQQIADALDAAEGYTDIASQTATQNNNAITEIVNEFINGYNNFAANTLRFNDVFDSDGEFTGKIRPTSIETAALFVGTRSQQLALNGIEFRVLPYEESINDKGVLQIISSEHSKNGAITQNARAGFMFHYGFGTDTAPKVYVVNEAELDIKTDLQKVSNHTLVSIGNNEYEANDGVYIYTKLTSKNEDYKRVENIDNNIFNEKYLFLYTKDGNNYSRVAGSNYNSIATYYVKNPAYVEDNTKSLAEYLEYTINDEESFIESVGKIYTRSGNNYNLVTKTYYSSGTDYYERNEESEVKNTATTESDATTGAGGQYANDFIADIFISQEQIKLKDVTNYLVIKLGYISIATNASKPNLKQRKVDMTYGSTTIDGRLITTGKIEGNGVSVDLDTGDIVGKITFKTDNGNYSADDYIESKYGDIYDYVLGDENHGIQKLIDGLQDQIDGVVDSYFLEGVPTLLTTKLPISDWENGGVIDYANHEGDTYTDILPLNFDLSEVKNNLPLWIEQGDLTVGTSNYGKTFEEQEQNSNNYCRLKGIISFEEDDVISAPPSGLSMLVCLYNSKYEYSTNKTWNTGSYTFTSSDASNYKYFTIKFRTTNNGGSSPVSPSDFMNSGSCLMSSTGDMKYAFSGHSWRFIYENSTPQWLEISDSEVVKALQMAAEAQDTADGKRRVFITDEGVLPTPPYDKGDLWANATYPANGSTYNNCLLRCKTARASGATANISDWQDSNRALQEIDNVTDDGIISKGSEKASLKKEFEEITGTYNKALDAIDTFDVELSVTTQKTALDNAYDALSDVMDIILDDTNENTSISGDLNMTKQEFRNLWVAYYSAEATLNDAIQKAAQDKISAYAHTINAETTAIKDGTTTIAGGMVKSNLIELNKFKYTEVESGSSFNPNTNYYIKQGNTYLYQRGLTSFQSGVTYYTASSGGVNSGVSGIDDFPAFWAGGDSIDAGGVRTFRDDYASISTNSTPYDSSTSAYKNYIYVYDQSRQTYTNTIYPEYQAIKNYADTGNLPNVFIDFDGISRFGDMYLIDNAIKWTPSTSEFKLYDSGVDSSKYLIIRNVNGALNVISGKNSNNQDFYTSAGMYADWISALGANSSGGGSGGDLNYADLWNELTSSSSEHYSGSTIINYAHLPLGYTQNNRNYPVQANNNKLYVNVPWTDHYNWSEITNKPFTSIGSNLSLSGGVLSGNPGTVTSVRVAATSPVQSSSSSSQTSTLNTTISLADGYGDTKNPYNSKTKNTFLAAPKSSNGVPSFREIEIEDLNNLQIGGRNLLIGSSNGVDWGYSTFDKATHEFTRSTTTTSEKFITSKTIKFIGGQTYTLSFWGKTNGYVNGVQTYKVNGGGTQVDNSVLLNTEWKYVKWTFICSGSGENNGYIRFDNNGSITSGTEAILYVKDVKLEKGNETTDWTPAPEDLLHISGGTMCGDIEVETNNTYDLGKSDKKWNNVYTNKIQIGDGIIEWANGGLHVYHKTNGNTAGLYADWISALGANSGGGSGGGGINWADFWNELNGTYDPSEHYSGNTIIDIDYIPNLSASKINSGTFDVDRIPNLSTDKLTSGTLPIIRGGTGRTTTASGAWYNTAANQTSPTIGTLPITQGGTGNTTGTATYTTTTADTSNTLYPIGVISSDTTTLKRDTGITFTNGVINAAKLRINTKSSSSNTNGGIFYYNGTTDYLLIGQGSSNLWIGANETAGTHHIGSTYISSGDGETYISRLVNSTRTNYKVLDAGNTYVSSNKGYINGTEITTISGNAATATILQTTRTINGTNFNGSANITTNSWGTARNISISDADGTNTGNAVSVNGSEAKTLKLPSTIKASLNGTVNGYTISATVNGGTANRLAYYTNNGIDDASTIYASNTKLAINSTTEPSQNLYVNGTSYFNSTMTVTSTESNRATLKLKTYDDYPNDFILGTNNIDRWSITCRESSDGGLGFYNYIVGSYRMKILQNGNVGIGTTTPPVKLSVAGDIYASGGVTALQTVTSDKRFKKNIKKFEAKEIINKLQPVEFEWNSKAKKLSDFQDGKNYGLIAQDSDNIIDNFVFDLPVGNGYKGVRYEKLIPILLQAVKEQQKEIDELKQIIRKLKV